MFTVGTTITPLRPSVTGVVTTYAIAPALPPGLSMDIDGVIHGTPTAAVSAAVYTARAINAGGNSTTVLTITVNPAITAPPTNLTYASPQLFVVGTEITSMQPSVTGLVESYGVNPALPAGLSLNTTTGVISGTPTAPAAQASYTVTALNSLGSTSFAISILVNPAAPTALTYQSPRIFTTGTAIDPLPPTVTGTVTSWTVAPALPAGLVISPSTGVISGIPTTVTPQAQYIVTAANVSGSTSFAVSITVVPPPLMPPSGLSYPNHRIYVVGTAIAPASPTVTGTVTSWSILPSLPPGLLFNTGNGSYSGTPTVATSQGVYRITAANTAGSTTFDLTLTVNPAPPQNLSYGGARIFVVGTAITAVNPSVTGSPSSYSVSPALPAGLTLDTTTGRIAGTPTAATAQAGYVITASNVSGSTSYTLTITVNPAAPTGLHYATPWTFVVGSPIPAIFTLGVTGTVTNYAVSPALPAGLAINSTTGTITGTPTVATAQAGYTVTASNVTGSTSFVITITVNALPPSGLSYPSPPAFTVGTAITPLDPTVTGTVTNWSVAPALPGGLSLNASNGRISGTPAVEAAQAVYTVTASNSGGLTSFGLSITVQPITTAPAAPAVTVGYSVKQVVLGWNPVAGATSYRVYKNADGASGYTQVSGVLTGTSYADMLAVHLTDWLNARYIVSACNSHGCSDSAAVFAMDSAKAIGYFKASDTEEQDGFGSSVAISRDGSTLAVGAIGKDSDATGVAPDCSGLNSNLPICRNLNAAGAVYVFVRTGSSWVQQAFLQAPNRTIYTGQQFGRQLSLSADGNTLAVGTYYDSSSATGIDGNPDDTASTLSGAVWVFARTNGTWSREAYIKASNAAAYAHFGGAVSLSSSGNTLAVGALLEASGPGEVPGNAGTGSSGNGSGAAYVFSRTGTVWTQRALLKSDAAGNPGQVRSFGQAVSLSGDGNFLAVGSVEGGGGAVYVFALNQSTWSKQAFLQPSDLESGHHFGDSVALSENGATVAVGGPCVQCNNVAPNWMGRAYVFTRIAGIWTQQAILVSSNRRSADYFGQAVAISSNGELVAVSAPYENSNATGINGDQTNHSANAAGAVYIFKLVGGVWSQTAYVKASNTSSNDFFGGPSISGDGQALAVGALGEDSRAHGIGGDQSDNSRADSGAVYVY